MRTAKGGSVLLAGTVAGYACSLVRNVILARLLSPTDMGVVFALFVSLALVEAVTDVSTEKLLVQHRHGDEEDFQSTIHTFSVVRGIVQGAALALLGPVLASWFGAPEAIWAFVAIGAWPVVRGFTHTDLVRAQRELRYGAAVAADLVPQVVGLALIWPFVAMTGNYWAIVWSSLAQIAAGVACSQMLAHRPYRFRINPDHLRAIATFGAPLMLNGLLLFGVQQGDKLFVGAGYSLEVLAVYSNAAMLVFMPSTIVARVASGVGLPLLAGAREHPAAFQRRFGLFAEAHALAGLAMIILMLGAGGLVLSLLFGPVYAAGGTIAAILGVAGAIRFVRMCVNLAALARGDSGATLLGNIPRGVCLIAAGAMALRGAGIEYVALAAVAGEAVGLVITAERLHRRQRVHTLSTVGLAVWMLAVSVGLGLGARAIMESAGELLGVLATLGALGAGGLLMLVRTPLLRAELAELFSRKFLARAVSDHGAGH